MTERVKEILELDQQIDSVVAKMKVAGWKPGLLLFVHWSPELKCLAAELKKIQDHRFVLGQQLSAEDSAALCREYLQ